MKHNLPKSWADVPLSKGKQIFSLDKNILNTEQFISATFEILTGLNYASLLITEIDSVNNQIQELLNLKPSGNLKRSFTIDGKEYHLQYNLTRCTWGEFVDLEMLIEKSGDNIWTEIENILGILLRPAKNETTVKYHPQTKKNKKSGKPPEAGMVEILNIELEDYDVHSRMQRSELFLDKLTTDDVFPIALFFYLNATNFLKVLIPFLKQEHQMLNTVQHSATI